MNLDPGHLLKTSQAAGTWRVVRDSAEWDALDSGERAKRLSRAGVPAVGVRMDVYGSGESERIIGKLLAGDPARASKVVIASKYMPMPWKRPKTALPASARASS